MVHGRHHILQTSVWKPWSERGKPCLRNTSNITNSTCLTLWRIIRCFTKLSYFGTSIHLCPTEYVPFTNFRTPKSQHGLLETSRKRTKVTDASDTGDLADLHPTTLLNLHSSLLFRTKCSMGDSPVGHFGRVGSNQWSRQQCIIIVSSP